MLSLPSFARSRFAILAVILVAALASVLALSTAVASPAVAVGEITVDGPPVPGTSPAPSAPPASTTAPSGAADLTADRPAVTYADIEQLPAWRWSTVKLDNDGGGILSNPLDQFPAAIGQFLMFVAGSIWSLLLVVFRIGLSSKDLLESASGPINFVFGWLGSHLLLFAAVFWGLALLRMLKQLITFEWVKMLRSLVAFALLFAFLAATSTASAEASKITDPAARLAYPATMPWIANTVVSFAGKAVAPLTGPLMSLQDGSAATEAEADAEGSGAVTDVNDPGVSTAPAAASAASLPPDCAHYIGAIEDKYSAGQDASPTLLLVSRLWQYTFYNSWMAAQFGTPKGGGANLPERAMCHWAEYSNGTSAADHAALVSASYPDGVNINATAPVLGPTFAGAEEMRSAATAWAACSYVDGAWVTSEEYKNVKNGSTGINDPTCQALFVEGNKTLGNDSDFFIFGDKVAEKTASDDPAVRSSLDAARDFGNAMTGMNGWDRVIQGFIALVVALLFLYALGMVALGLLFAQLMAIVCLMFAVPAAFVLYALGMNKQGGRLIKITLTSTLSQVLFTVLLSVLVIMTQLFQSIAGYISIPGVFGAMVFGLAPLAAFFAIRQLLKSIGLGDIMTATGAMSFATAASLKATGDQKLAAKGRPGAGKDGKSGVSSAISRIPFLGRGLTAMDRRSPSELAKKVDPRLDARARRAKAAKQRKVEKERRDQARDQALSASAAARPNTPVGRALARMDRHLMSGSDTRSRVRSLLNAPRSYFRRNTTSVANEFSGSLTAAVAAVGTLASRGFGATIDKGRRQRNAADRLNRVVSSSNSWSEQSATLSDEERAELGDPQYNRAGVLDAADSAESTRHATADFVTFMGRTPPEGSSMTAEDLLLRSLENMLDRFQQAAWNTSGQVFAPDELQAMRMSYAEAHGIDLSRVAMTAGGVAMAMPLTNDQLRVNATLEDAQYFANWLPADMREKQMVTDGGVRRLERPDEYAARMYTIGVASGYMKEDGTLVDALRAGLAGERSAGMDEATLVAEFAKFQKGLFSDVFSNVKIELPDSASLQRAIDAAYTVVRAQDTAMRVDVASQIEAAAESAARSFEAIKTDAQATSATVGDLTSALSDYAFAHEQLLDSEGSSDEEYRRNTAATFSALSDAMDVKLATALEQITDVMSRTAEAQAAATGTLTDNLDKYTQTLNEGLGKMADVGETVEKAVRGLKDGTVDVKDAVKVLKDAQSNVEQSAKDAHEHLEDAVKHSVTHQERLRSTSPRKKTTYTTKSGLWVVEQDGRPSFPDVP